MRRSSLIPLVVLLVVCAGFVACPGASAQRGKRQRIETPAVVAGKLVKLLEQPGKRADAVNRLLRLGPAAVPALTAALRDPRPEIVTIALSVIGSLGTVATAALPELEKLANGEDPRLARAARWAKHKMRPVGVTLIAEYSGGMVTRIDAKGNVTTVPGLSGPFDIEQLPNGNYLVVEYSKNAVRELDAKGKEVWAHPKLNQPLDADRLANGNTLIVERSGGGRVIEVTPKGEIAWKYSKVGKAPQDAERLPNGNTLVAFFKDGHVVEVDPKGETVWQLTKLGSLSDADRLANGNTLLALHADKLVREVDPSGKTVMEIRLDTSPSDADRLPNGHVLVAHNTAVVEFDAKGKEVWRRAARYAGEVNRY